MSVKSLWEVEAPDEEVAKEMARDALTGHIEESDSCHRTVAIDDDDGNGLTCAEVDVMDEFEITEVVEESKKPSTKIEAS
jgi:hypothetical protein